MCPLAVKLLLNTRLKLLDPLRSRENEGLKEDPPRPCKANSTKSEGRSAGLPTAITSSSLTKTSDPGSSGRAWVVDGSGGVGEYG
jgi:hypothetical protein